MARGPRGPTLEEAKQFIEELETLEKKYGYFPWSCSCCRGINIVTDAPEYTHEWEEIYTGEVVDGGY